MTHRDAEKMPDAYSYELAHSSDVDGYSNWHKYITEDAPYVPEGSIRNLKPLYSRATPPCDDGRGELSKGNKLGAEESNLFPDGSRDTCTYADVEQALRDLGSSPYENGKWLTLPERIAALSAPISVEVLEGMKKEVWAGAAHNEGYNAAIDAMIAKLKGE